MKPASERQHNKQMIDSIFFEEDQNRDPEVQAIPYFKSQNYNVQAYSKFIENAQSQSKPKRDNALKKIASILENINEKHQEAKRKLEEIKKAKVFRNEKEISNISFNPILTRSRRYPVNNSISVRNKSWDEVKLKNYLTLKEQIIQQEYKECTFSPTLQAKKKSIQILKIKEENQIKKKREKEKEKEKQHKDKDVKDTPFLVVSVKNFDKKSKSSINYKAIKDMIKYEISRIKYD